MELTPEETLKEVEKEVLKNTLYYIDVHYHRMKDINIRVDKEKVEQRRKSLERLKEELERTEKELSDVLAAITRLKEEKPPEIRMYTIDLKHLLASAVLRNTGYQEKRKLPSKSNTVYSVSFTNTEMSQRKYNTAKILERIYNGK